jgi:heptosyltransferase III
MQHIAIIHMGAIGDLVQALPTLRAIRQRWPGARLTLIGRPERAVLARMAGLADECLDYDTMRAPASSDLVIDFLSAAPPDSRQTVVAVNPLPPANWTEPAAAWILRQTSARLDLPAVPPAPEIPVPAATMETACGVLAKAGISKGFVAIHPGSGSLKKNWPLERFVEIARRLRAMGRQTVWLSGPAERDRGTLGNIQAMTESTTGQGRPWHPPETVLAELPLDVLAGVLALAGGYLGNDSGITQIAAAVRSPDGRSTPTVSLFGPTDARIWAPRGRHVRLVAAESRAMEGIPTEGVWNAVRSVLL